MRPRRVLYTCLSLPAPSAAQVWHRTPALDVEILNIYKPPFTILAHGLVG